MEDKKLIHNLSSLKGGFVLGHNQRQALKNTLLHHCAHNLPLPPQTKGILNKVKKIANKRLLTVVTAGIVATSIIATKLPKADSSQKIQEETKTTQKITPTPLKTSAGSDSSLQPTTSISSNSSSSTSSSSSSSAEVSKDHPEHPIHPDHP